MNALDSISLVVTTVGFVLSVALLRRCLGDWRKSRAQWAYRAAVMSSVLCIVWVGYAATLSGRISPDARDAAPWFAIGARLTLLSMVIWLLVVQYRSKPR